MSEDLEGIYLIDKQVGVSSFWIVRRLRKVLNIKKIGHAGTLDPFASGLLVVCAGRQWTRQISQLMEGDKEYEAVLRLGIRTSTLDPEGEVVSSIQVGLIEAERVSLCLRQFLGEQEQVPPIYSAVKHQGKPLYFYARQGIAIEKPPRRIFIHTLARTDGTGDLTGDTPRLRIRVVCSKGTYIRTLAAEIGNSLGCGAYLEQLRRTRSGNFSVDRAVSGLSLASEMDSKSVVLARLNQHEVWNLLQNKQELTKIPVVE